MLETVALVHEITQCVDPCNFDILNYLLSRFFFLFFLKEKLKEIEISIIVSFSWIHGILYKKFVFFRVLENSNPLVSIPIHTQICYNFYLKKEKKKKNLHFILFFLIIQRLQQGRRRWTCFFNVSFLILSLLIMFYFGHCHHLIDWTWLRDLYFFIGGLHG